MDYYQNLNHGNNRRILLPADAADERIAELEKQVADLCLMLSVATASYDALAELYHGALAHIERIEGTL